MRGTNVNDGRADNNNTLDTINAAAFAIASAQNRVSQPSTQKKRWGSWLGKIGCFGYQKSRKRIGHAVLVPEPTCNGADPAASSNQAPSITLPFVAPPSSPASFFQSEPPSTGVSPGGPASIFAIGPYAHETQLVSPPVFSASSTAPFTPPFTTPSSPEVPFAQLLDPNNKNAETFQRFQISHYDFQSYQFHPGSPVAQLISPRSTISSPLPDSEFNATFSHILDFPIADPPKLLNLDSKLSACENRKSNHGSGSLTPDAARSTTQSAFLSNHWVSEIKMSPHPSNNRLNEISINHRVSFELSAQKVLKSLENKPAASVWTNVVSKLKNDAPTTDKEEKSVEAVLDEKQVVKEAHNDQPLEEITLGGEKATTTVHEKDQSLTLSSAKEFNFDNADGGDSLAPNIVADWWANEKVAGKEREASKDWSFFPLIQPGVS
ncbi:hypothetical protein AAZX31_08G015600 [Glycine max]|uniref:Hydroxyproline-rich glycoprotein family protein n=2 Tax=Glycine subgen. Soja TaxID=1462606 RepID=I1KPC2_SOYBN|nr:uncharacterized protein LOC100814955 [Glycine max]XP_028242579.1 uncharacterized protein LOC114421027 [Glycine soja]KAG5014495.1 hypothetical protein JHK85_020631 [Glycine max]KAG5024278.1 hypothetical protein JHK86_020192 [Glycine max]KAG5135447.1 hypothetical protein JHK82_020178 [Glycine max]KAH1049118.1 hypothetical protein GYH30_019931 [Glycine max]KAH1235652.1 Uncharacterized protein GmHk_08G021074 [Glycine max]|eukprot:XP_003532416.1 uncharacterized protein LOC100814955 [Glycine max]